MDIVITMFSIMLITGLLVIINETYSEWKVFATFILMLFVFLMGLSRGCDDIRILEKGVAYEVLSVAGCESDSYCIVSKSG